MLFFRIRYAVLPSQLRIAVGSSAWKNTKAAQVIPVAELIVHERWNLGNAKNDIALIRTQYPIKYTNSVNPICLPRRDSEPIGYGIVAGWGLTNRNPLRRVLPRALQRIEIPIINKTRCVKQFRADGVDITKDMVCAGMFRNGDCLVRNYYLLLI